MGERGEKRRGDWGMERCEQERWQSEATQRALRETSVFFLRAPRARAGVGNAWERGRERGLGTKVLGTRRESERGKIWKPGLVEHDHWLARI